LRDVWSDLPGRRHRPWRPVPDLAAGGLRGPARRTGQGRPRRPRRPARPAAPGPPRSRRMSGPAHVPVLLDAVLEAIEPAPGKRIVDATFGAGGYSKAFLDAGAEVIAF